MNKFISAIILILLCLGSFAQELQWERVFQDGFQHEVTNIYQLGFNNIAIQEKTQPSEKSFEVSRNLCLTWDGEVSVWENFPTELIVPATFPDSIGQVYSFGVNRVFCDWCATGIYGEWNISSQNLNNYERRYDFYQLADLIYENQEFYSQLDSINAPNYMFGFPLVKGMFQPDTNTLIIAGGNVIARISLAELNGFANIEDYEPILTERNIIGLFQGSLNTGLLFTQDTLFSINEDFEIQYIQELQTELDSIISTTIPGIFMGVSGNNYYRINENGDFLENLNISVAVEEIMQIELSLDGYRMLALINNETHLLNIEDGTETLNFIPDTIKFQPQKFVFNNDGSQFMIIGNETAVPNKHLVIRKYGMENTGYEASLLNLALVAIDFQQSTGYVCAAIPGFSGTHYEFIPALVKVKNTSASEINSFYINATWDSTGNWPLFICPSSCFERQFSIHYDTLILPNESVDIQLWFANPGNSNGVSLPVCMWTSSPNSQIDIDPSDDKLCMEVPLNTSNPQSYEQDLVIYPNPIKNSLFIKLNKDETIKSAEIFDFTGKSVLRKNESNTIQTIDVSTLSAGLYLINLFEKSGKVYSRKFVVTNK